MLTKSNALDPFVYVQVVRKFTFNRVPLDPPSVARIKESSAQVLIDRGLVVALAEGSGYVGDCVDFEKLVAVYGTNPPAIPPGYRVTGLALLLLLMCSLFACAPKRYRVCWTGPYTHDNYCGKPMPRKVAEAWAQHENTRFPEIRHQVRRAAR